MCSYYVTTCQEVSKRSFHCVVIQCKMLLCQEVISLCMCVVLLYSLCYSYITVWV